MTNFNTGDRVIIVRSKYKDVGPDLVGTVRRNYMGSIAVSVDDFHNKNSEYGWYYFTSTQLEKLAEAKETFMDGKYRVALVKFFDGTNTDKAYEYACYDNSINKNDYVVVKTAHHGFAVAQINDFAENVGQKITREIVCKADFSEYKARLKARKRRDELRKDMSVQAAKMQEIAMYKMLAESDPVMKQMLDEYLELTNGN